LNERYFVAARPNDDVLLACSKSWAQLGQRVAYVTRRLGWPEATLLAVYVYNVTSNAVAPEPTKVSSILLASARSNLAITPSFCPLAQRWREKEGVAGLVGSFNSEVFNESTISSCGPFVYSSFRSFWLSCNLSKAALTLLGFACSMRWNHAGHKCRSSSNPSVPTSVRQVDPQQLL
jgi:hypothetical protein